MRVRSVIPVLAAIGLACAGGPASPPDPPDPPDPVATAAPVVLPAMPSIPPPVAPMPDDMAFYFTRPILLSDVDGKSLRALTLMRNTIYARAGNPFRKRWLDAYFRAQPWYTPNARMDESRLSSLDRTNAAFVARYEAGLTRAVLGARLDAFAERLKAHEELPDADLIEVVLLTRAAGEDLVQWAANGEVTVPPRIHTLVEVTPLDDPKMLDRQLAVEDLRDLSKRDLRLLRNTVYARHGREFQSPTLQGYFARMEWYRPDPGFTDTRLSELDQRNVKLVQSVEDSIGGPMTEHEQQTAESWFDGA